MIAATTLKFQAANISKTEKRENTNFYSINTQQLLQYYDNDNSRHKIPYSSSDTYEYSKQLEMTAIENYQNNFMERSQSEPTTFSTLLLLNKSNSNSNSCDAIQSKPKSTILIQDSHNGRISTSLTESGNYDDDDDDYDGDAFNHLTLSTTNAAAAVQMSANDIGYNETDTFLCTSTVGHHNNVKSVSSNRHSFSLKAKTKSFCLRSHAFISHNWYLSYLVPLSIVLALVIVAYLMRNYATQLLYWIEMQNPWLIFVIVMLLFVLVSFPVVVGYFVLMITSGYLFGCIKGFLIVILGANLGIAIAHVTIRSLRHHIPIHKLIKNETGRAILRVIAGPRAFKVVLFTRLTPIPFGLQNAIFGVSSVNPRVYHTATFLGLLPAQIINVYLGSTLRSMHEVLNNQGTALTGYISFGIEVVCGIALMFWVLQKARKELSQTLLGDIGSDGKLINIQV